MVKTLNKREHSNSRSNLIRIAKLHMALATVLAVQIIIYDAGKLITPEAVLKRWIFTGVLAFSAVVVWYLARLNDTRTVIRNLVWYLIAVDIIFASFSVYTQRGMASRAVLLFILPILVSSVLHRWGVIFLTAVLSVITYIVTAVAYFVLNFNEGYKLELYGEILFYSAVMLIIARIIWTLVRNKN